MRRLNTPVKHCVKQAPIALIALVVLSCFIFGACGKRSAPIPPSERVRQRVEISGFQRGDQVILSWLMPARNAPKGNVQNIARIDIYRLAEPLNSPQRITEEEFSNRATLITVMPVTDADFGVNKTLQYRDQLQFANQAARLRYAVRLVNASGQKAAFSNVLLIEPAAKIAQNPTSLSAEVSQDAITLRWQPPTANIDQTTPPSVLGYNIYRSDSDKTPGRLLNKTPVPRADYADEFFEFGKSYFYFVRTVSPGLAAEPVESTESNILAVKPVDTFAPSAPAAITIAAAPGSISIFWAVNPEKDIKGYALYRSEDPDKPVAEWERLTPTLWDRNTYQDTRVERGKRYYYYLTATDVFGNTSPPSDPISEQVP